MHGFLTDKNDRCVFTRDSRREVMIFFEKNKVLGVEANRVLNILWTDHLTCKREGGYQGRIQDFKLGGGALKKIAPSGGRRENFWGISCEKSRFYAKKSYFFRLRREARKFLRYFV